MYVNFEIPVALPSGDWREFLSRSLRSGTVRGRNASTASTGNSEHVLTISELCRIEDEMVKNGSIQKI